MYTKHEYQLMVPFQVQNQSVAIELLFLHQITFVTVAPYTCTMYTGVQYQPSSQPEKIFCYFVKRHFETCTLFALTFC